MSNDDIKDILLQGANSHSLSGSISNIVNKFMMEVVKVWLEECFEKYSEEYYHEQMRRGFKFISDWKINHAEKYAKFINMTHKPLIRSIIKIDENDILKKVELILNKKGWVMYDSEKQLILADIRELKKDIYGR